MKEPEDAGKYQVNNKTVQGQVIGDNPIVHQHFYAAQDKATSSTKPQQPWNIPYLRNDYFTGREEILAELHTRFKANHATALSQRHAMSGLGGIGKTQTAVEYAYRCHEDYQAVLWAHAESHETLTSSFVEVATLLNLPQKDEQDQTITVQAVKHWLQDNKGWLLILDNADEPEIVREFLPTKFDGHILLTTRAQALGGLAKRIEVDTLTPKLGALFLLRRATMIGADGALEDTVQSDREVAIEISKELGGLPLALDQAGAYIEETGCLLQDYQQIYQQHRIKLLKERRGLVDDHPEPVATTWALSFAKVEEKNAAAAELLRFCAFLAPEDIAVEMIAQGAPHLGAVLEPVVNDAYELNQAIEVLRAYSLVQRDPNTGALSIHRLVQAVLRDAMAEDETKVWTERTVQAVSEACPVVEFATWSQWERYLSHAQACAELIEQGDLMFPEASLLLNRTGFYLRERGRYTEAELLYMRALAIREQQLGADHPDTAQSLNNLAELYRSQGKYGQAQPLLVRALAICEQQLGADHPDTAQSLNNLAVLYNNQGKHVLAESLNQRALAIREQQLGADHPDTAQSLNNLAGLYYSQGKHGQAKPLLVRALAIYEQQLGADHPDTALSLNNLAELYRSQGKYGQAQPLYQRALAIREQQLGADHPDTAQSLNNLAGLYYSQGKYRQVQPLLVRALAIREQRLGADHPDTAQSLNNLAGLYYSQGKYGQAKPLLVRALAISEQRLGADHPNTQQARQNYATLLQAMGRDEEAKQLEEEQ